MSRDFCRLILMCILSAPTVLSASQARDSVAWALEAHSGEIRILEARDMKRNITVTAAPTYRVKADGDGPTIELSFADIDTGSGIGFDHPTLGQTRVNTAIAVFEYAANQFPMHSGTARVHFEESITDPSFQFSGQAYPFYPGYPCEAGYQTPLMLDAIVNDQHMGEIDGSIILNFGPAVNWNDDHTQRPASTEMDLYSLILHEAGHVLGFLGFAFDEEGSRISCDGLPAFPNFTHLIRNDDGRPIWTLVNGVPTFSGDDNDLSAAEFAYLEMPGMPPEATRLHKNSFISGTEVLRSFSGHWHPSLNVLMTNNNPVPGFQTFQFSPLTMTFLNDVIGYGNTEAESLLGLTGSWFDPASDGRGFNIQFINDTQFIIYFYGFLDNQERFWLIGVYSGGVAYGSAMEISMLESDGGVFNNYDPNDVAVTPWGTLTITFTDCDTALATLSGPEGEVVFNLTRLAGVEGLSC